MRIEEYLILDLKLYCKEGRISYFEFEVGLLGVRGVSLIISKLSRNLFPFS